MAAKVVHDGHHKYQRAHLWGNKKNVIYKCALPDCPHYLSPEMTINRVSKCWGCEGEVLIDYYIVKQARTRRPICEKCKAAKKKFREELKKIS